MTREEAIRILDPETTGEALAEIEYYGGFRGRAKAAQALYDACILAVSALREQEERRTSVTNADKIRSMTDEELAKVLNSFTTYFVECNRSADEVDCGDCELNDLCSLHEGKAIDWLQQPAQKP